MLVSAVPQFPTDLPGEFWGVTVYFNRHHVPIQLQNLLEFSQCVRRQGLKLLVVELAFGDDAFQVAEEAADRVVRRRTNSVLWQKERLLNIGIAELPAACDKVAWLDNDILFENDAWVGETAELLASFVVVQPYATACWLPAGVHSLTQELPVGIGEGKCLPGIVAGLAAYQTPAARQRALANYLLSGHTGFAWAARRSLLQAHPLYDRDIVGGADVPIAHAFLGDEDFWQGRNFYCRHLTPAAMGDIAQWSRAVDQAIGGSVAFTPGRALHLWHGSIGSRSYIARLQILLDNAFDPTQDVRIDADGCWTWCSDKPQLHQQVETYFAARRAAVTAQGTA